MFFEILYNKRMKITRLHHAYDFPEFNALATVREHPQDTSAVVVTLMSPRKKMGSLKDSTIKSAYFSAGHTDSKIKSIYDSKY